MVPCDQNSPQNDSSSKAGRNSYPACVCVRAYARMHARELKGQPASAGWHLKDARMVTDEPMSCTKVEHSPLAKAHSLSSVHFLPGPLLPTPPPSSYSNISHHSSHTSGLSESPFRLIMPEAYVRCWHKVVQLNHTGLTSEISSGSGVMVQDTMGKFVRTFGQQKSSIIPS